MSISSYVNHAVADVYDLPSATTEVLETIEKLDDYSQKISKALDSVILSASPDKKTVDTLKLLLEDIAEKKILLALRNYDLIDRHIRILDKRISTVDLVLKHRSPSGIDQVAPPIEKSSGGRKRKKSRNPQVEEIVDNNLAIESLEPVYCTCQRVAFGEMIACDNEDCPIEWFHYCCVGLTKQPKKSWYCQQCRPNFL